jgi:hypothetical protein
VAKLKGAIEESMKGHQNRQTFWYALNLKILKSCYHSASSRYPK